MLLKPDEFKSLVETLSKVIDARAKTTETLVKAEINASEDRLRAEAKADHLHLAGKVDRMAKSHD